MIRVMYKDYSPEDNQQHIIIETFDSWTEEGNYTSFYSKYENENSVPDITIPTHAICWIKVI